MLNKDDSSDCKLNNFTISKDDINNGNNYKIIESKLPIIKSTLPGFILQIIFDKKGNPVSENEIYEIVLPVFSSLRKPDGLKYKTNLRKVLISTLSASGLFEKVSDNLWNYKEEESLEYVERAYNKIKEKETKNNNSEAKVLNKK